MHPYIAKLCFYGLRTEVTSCGIDPAATASRFAICEIYSAARFQSAKPVMESVR
jgi:hypothetical protein